AHRERARRSVAGRRQRRLPEQPSGCLVKGAELRVLRRGDEYQAARGDDGSPVLFGPGGNPARRKRGMLAERDSPAVLAGVEVDRAQRAPRRLDRRKTVRVSPALVTGEL